jgi:DNA-binding GntR family transcriptional regulator
MQLEIVGGRYQTKQELVYHTLREAIMRCAALLDSMERATAEGDHERWAELNTQFHRQITRIAGMPMLQEMTERAMAHWDRLRRYFFSGVLAHRMDQANGEHRQMVAVMQAREYERLEDLVKHHNRDALDAYSDYLLQHAD